MTFIYPVRVLENGFWRLIGTYWKRDVAEQQVSKILQSQAKRWRNVESVRIAQRQWTDEESIQEWTKEQKP